MGRRGRPAGFRLSEESKQAIREAKKGQRHRQETKDKILINVERAKVVLSEETKKHDSFVAQAKACDPELEILGRAFHEKKKGTYSK